MGANNTFSILCLLDRICALEGFALPLPMSFSFSDFMLSPALAGALSLIGEGKWCLALTSAGHRIQGPCLL